MQESVWRGRPAVGVALLSTVIQHLCSYDLITLYKSVYYYFYSFHVFPLINKGNFRCHIFI